MSETRIDFDRGNGVRIAILMPTTTKDRLKSTCFRGKEKQVAGNFCAWGSFAEMLTDNAFVQPCLDVLDDLYEGQRFGRSYSFSIDYPLPVGWSSTIRLTPDLAARGLVRRYLNTRSTAFFPTDPTIRASLTHTVTVKCELKLESPMCGVAVVHSIYPGLDMGSLIGDMTEQTGFVWLDWATPGSFDLPD